MAIFNFGGWSWPRRGTGASSGDNFVREPVMLGVAGKVREVTRETAFQMAAILCAARVVSQGIAQVPLKIYREVNENGRVRREPARDHALYRLLSEQPNDGQTSFTLLETLMMHALVGSDGYVFINRREGAWGEVRELLPMVPDQVKPVWSREKGLVYEHGRGASKVILRPDEVLHIHGPSWDGYSGLSAVGLARDTIGLSASLRDSQSSLMDKGGRPSGILTAPEVLGSERREQIQAAWAQRFGPGGDGGVALLDAGMTFTTMQMSSVDAQVIESMRFLIEEVARFMMVFPQMLMQADKPTYASVEQFFIAHLVHTLDPWMVRIEQELKRSLIGYEGENADLYPRFTREGLLRGAARDRAEFYKAALGAGGSPAWMTPNEVRALENMNPIEGGDGLPQPAGSPALGHNGGPPMDGADTTEEPGDAA